MRSQWDGAEIERDEVLPEAGQRTMQVKLGSNPLLVKEPIWTDAAGHNNGNLWAIKGTLWVVISGHENGY